MKKALMIACFVVPVLIWPKKMRAQFTQVLYVNEDVEGIDSLLLDFSGDITVEPWASNKVLIETTIQLFQVKQGILAHYVENGRYDTLREKKVGTLKLSNAPKNPLAPPSREVVNTVVYVPDRFKHSASGIWINTRP